jgi:hypothetical protein
MVQNRIKINGGTVALVRNVLPGDCSFIEEMHQRLSPATLYLRYLRPYSPTPADIQRICRLEDDGNALVAVLEMHRPVVIGVAYSSRQSTDDAAHPEQRVSLPGVDGIRNMRSEDATSASEATCGIRTCSL